MTLPILPLSPMPVALQRLKNWNEDSNWYDSGDSQGATAFVKPLYEYGFPIQAMNELKQSSLWAFWDTRKGTTSPFLMKDPYDYRVQSVIGVRSGYTHAATLFLADINSYMVRADTTSIGSLSSTLSGYVRLGVEYSYDVDTGIFLVNTKTITDVWGVRSMQYWKKAKFASPLRERSIIWNIFGYDNVAIKELP